MKQIRPLFIALLLLWPINSQADSPRLVIILADDSYPPYSYVKDGRVTGIYVDLITQAAQKIADKYYVKIKPLPWKRALNEIKNGKYIAIIPPYQHLKSRRYIKPYSVSLLSEKVVAFCHKDINLIELIKQNTTALNRPINIGINAGYLILNDRLIRAKHNNKIKVWEHKNTQANVNKLMLKRMDCYINDSLSTLWILKKLQKDSPEMNFDEIEQSFVVMERTAHIGYVNSPSYLFTYKDDFIKQMDQAILELKDAGELDKIVAKYLQ
ncbi:ABC transporter substrate-binding protein [Psychrobium sp. 1_MG-2023]|uniref:substrate-binding periplasmic protein n=1 Tax=Psychrobium sp. 1_MG-2023 TaxID=3062624 RepID=UPI0027323E70|nr:transporter substrate-binding domain-containing protein [Psychrobium sp. 1_MG-2023]MDP2560115.1 transporter substrate-binding domain-containing protein [Psychrobium sp. 1_MG-2023]